MIQIKNISEFQAMLGELSSKVQKEVMKKSYKEAVKPLVQQMRDNVDSKRVKKSIGVEYDSSKGEAKVGARTGNGYAGYIGRWYEGGTVERQHRTTKRKLKANKNYKPKRTGRMTATHFFSRAIEATEKRVFDNLQQSFINTMNKIIAKYSKK